MKITKPYTIAFGDIDGSQNVLKSVSYHGSYEEAMSKAIDYKNLARADKHSLVQVEHGNNAFAMRYDKTKVSWVITEPFWAKEEIHKQGNLARLYIPLTKTKEITKEMRMRLKCGWEQSLRELFQQKFSIMFHTHVEQLTDVLTPGDTKLRYECTIPEEAVKVLERSYGCVIEKVRM